MKRRNLTHDPFDCEKGDNRGQNKFSGRRLTIGSEPDL
jgi:hypothetical protein